MRLSSVELLQFIQAAILSGLLSAFAVCYSTGTPGIQMMKAPQKEVTLLPDSEEA